MWQTDRQTDSVNTSCWSLSNAPDWDSSICKLVERIGRGGSMLTVTFGFHCLFICCLASSYALYQSVPVRATAVSQYSCQHITPSSTDRQYHCVMLSLYSSHSAWSESMDNSSTLLLASSARINDTFSLPSSLSVAQIKIDFLLIVVHGMLTIMHSNDNYCCMT